MALISGWGRGTWSEGEWGTPLPVEVTGVSASGQVGSVTVSADANVPETGLQATGNVGGVQVNTDQVLEVTGLLADVGVTQFYTYSKHEDFPLGTGTQTIPGSQVSAFIGCRCNVFHCWRRR